jgi:hypothetical protein
VHEDDGQRGVGRPDLVDGEQHPVAGLHQGRAVGPAAGGAERVLLALLPRRQLGDRAPVGPGLSGQLVGPHRGRGRPGDRDPDRRPGRGQADRGADQAGGAAQVVLVRVLRHHWTPAVPTWRRRNRPPTRVTNS